MAYNDGDIKLDTWLPLAAGSYGDVDVANDPSVLTALTQYNLHITAHNAKTGEQIEPLLANTEEFDQFVDDVQEELGREPDPQDVVEAIQRLSTVLK
jgi:hypothetical protein